MQVPAVGDHGDDEHLPVACDKEPSHHGSFFGITIGIGAVVGFQSDVFFREGYLNDGGAFVDSLFPGIHHKDRIEGDQYGSAFGLRVAEVGEKRRRRGVYID